jgi:hypothetical protein
MGLRYSRSGSDGRPADDQPADDQPADDQETSNEATGDPAPVPPPAAADRRPFTTGIGSMVGPEDDETVPPTRPTFTARPGEPVTPVPEPAPAFDNTAFDNTAFDNAGPDSATRTGDTLPGAPPPALGPDDGGEPARAFPEAPAFAPDDGAPAAAGVMPGTGPVPGAAPVPGPAPVPGAAPVPGPDLASPDGNRPGSLPPSAAGLDEPLLSGAEGLRARWQHVQASFVDDPQVAVGEAADLIEQTAQAMVGALRQRQRQLRVMWEGDPAGDAGPAGNGPASGGPAALRQDTEHLRQVMRHYRALFNQLARS